MATHEVTNVPPLWSGVNVFGADQALADRLVGTEPSWTVLKSLGALAGGAQAAEWARQANTFTPTLRSHDRYGRRIDEVEFHPAWHRLMTVAIEHGLHGAPWASDSPVAHLTRAVGFFVWSQAEAGHGCPISMTYAAVPALRHTPSLAAQFEPLLCAPYYDFGLRPPSGKSGLLAGMAMTEKHGGSDVRANTTRAMPAGEMYRLTGHKWFCSAPMSDLFLVLAQAPGGLSCFLVPRVLPDGRRNPFLLQRLKDKLGNRSNASSEVEFDETLGWLVGDEGRGVPTILDMVTMTRLDCIIGSAATQRAALTQAMHHARYRSAFGAPLLRQPLMRQVLADLALETEAATALFMRLAAAVDAGESDFLRLAVAAGKYWVCKRTPTVVGEALECLGGNGYVEENAMPRLFRESPLNSIWEGSGNVICLDVLRTLRRDPASVDALFAELDLSSGTDPRLNAAVMDLRREVADPPQERAARRISGRIARCLQAALLVRTAPPAIADAFVATRIAAEPSAVAGEAAAEVDVTAVLQRAEVA